MTSDDMKEPLLEALYELAEPSTPKKVMDYLEPRIRSKLAPGDYEKLSTGEVRWHNRVHWARYLLSKEGLVDSPERGIWKITEAGRRRVELQRNQGQVA